MTTSWPLSRTQMFDLNGDLAPGAKVYFYDGGTTNPRTTYQDADATTSHAHPVVADANGRWPRVFLQFGSYDEKVTTAGGTELWNDTDIPNPEPADPETGVSSTSLLVTGDIFFNVVNTTRTGAVRLNGRTIGSATSGATERANADTANLFAYYWNGLSNTAAPVSGGRGANPAADFAANKTLTLPDCRGTAPIGFNDMGNASAARFPFTGSILGTPTTSGSMVGGTNNNSTLVLANLPATEKYGEAFAASTLSAGASNVVVSPNSHTGFDQPVNIVGRSAVVTWFVVL